MTITDISAASTEAQTAAWLLTPEAIRSQCGALYELGLQGQLQHFELHPENLPHAASEVVATIHAAYPDLAVPPHARWRHFVLGGRDRWAEIAETLAPDRAELARLEFELAILSVLLDAGAGPSWHYTDPGSGAIFIRSEGLALASLHLFVLGGFNDGRQIGTSLRGLQSFTAEDLAEGFQVSPENPLEGLEGRASLIARLGDAVEQQPEIFGDMPRLGHLADHLFALAEDHELPARTILTTLLEVFGAIWPERPEMAGLNLGDCWEHPQAPDPGLVPFHKLSQWLSYSLIEPLERAGLTITGLDELTGLSEYRNGGLFLDSGVLSLRDPAMADTPQDPACPLIVEWRALTVCLLDRVAEEVRAQLGLTAQQLPLAAVLEGGTWATGRRLAKAARPGGPPPIAIKSSGTVF